MEEQSTIETNPNRIDDFLSIPLLSIYQIDWEKSIYVLIIVLTILSRFWGLGDRVVSHDESLHTHYSFQYYNGDGYSHTPLMHGPFLFHITAFSYWLFGANDFTARIPVALFGLFLVLTPYFLRHWIGRVGALVASFILLISPYSLYYARYIRHDVYVIAWALIIFIATWYYFRNRDDLSLWWFSAGLALLFATKEVSFIYVAIFGSYLVIRLLLQVGGQSWFWKNFTSFSLSAILLIVGIGVIGVGGVLEVFEPSAITESIGERDPIAADPNAEQPVSDDGEESGGFSRWLVVIGFFLLSAGLFLMADKNRAQFSQFPEFDLIVLYTTLILPMMAALLVAILGGNPIDYNFPQCAVPEGATGIGAAVARITSGNCWQLALSSNVIITLFFVLILLAVSIYVGIWWDARRWTISAIIFIIPFALLYTSFFSNPWGIMTGTVGSLGYWLDQQEVARGSQPWFYYAVVVPIYEFMPVIFSFLAIRYWFRYKGMKVTTRLYGWLLLAALILGSLVTWLYNETNDFDGDNYTRLYGLIVAGILLLLGIAFHYFSSLSLFDAGFSTIKNRESENRVENYFGFVPSLIWWLIFTAVAYTIAGEKMPWLSIHFVIPMAFLVGWYINQLLSEVDLGALFTRKHLIWSRINIFISRCLGHHAYPIDHRSSTVWGSNDGRLKLGCPICRQTCPVSRRWLQHLPLSGRYQ